MNFIDLPFETINEILKNLTPMDFHNAVQSCTSLYYVKEYFHMNSEPVLTLTNPDVLTRVLTLYPNFKPKVLNISMNPWVESTLKRIIENDSICNSITSLAITLKIENHRKYDDSFITIVTKASKANDIRIDTFNKTLIKLTSSCPNITRFKCLIGRGDLSSNSPIDLTVILSNLKKLEELIIWSHHINIPVPYIENLQILDICCYDTNFEFIIKLLETNTRIKHLTFDYDSKHDIKLLLNVISFLQLETLEIIFINHNNMIKDISQIPDIKRLKLYNPYFSTDKELLKFLSPTLEHIKISNTFYRFNHLPGETLSAVSTYCKNIRTICINVVDSYGVIPINALYNLSELEHICILSAIEGDSPLINLLRYCEKLVKVNLPQYEFKNKDELLEFINEIPKLNKRKILISVSYKKKDKDESLITNEEIYNTSKIENFVYENQTNLYTNNLCECFTHFTRLPNQMIQNVIIRHEKNSL